MKRLTAYGLLGAAAAALLWWLPAFGAVLFAIFVVVVPPWGRTYRERGIISVIVTVGLVAVVFPRAGETPVDTLSVRLFLVALMFVMFTLNFLPSQRNFPLPRPGLPDAAIVFLVAALWFVLSSPYLGGSAAEVVTGLYFSGWDNHAHFTTFANTYVSQSTSWPTLDGTLAWNQWYPSLHTTLWAMGTFLVDGEATNRLGLLIPYVQWSALSFALALGALAWIAMDFANRWGSRTARRTGAAASGGAFLFVAAWTALGSPQFLFNAGFTNFTMGATLVATANYLSVRTSRSAVTLGWFVVPLASIAVVGLWTPLILGLVPAGIIVTVSLMRHRVPLGIGWLAASVVILMVISTRQLGDVLSAGGDADAAEFATNIGSVSVGMSPFNLTAALAAPAIAVAIAVLVNGPNTLRWGIAGPSVMTAVVALTFVPGAVSAGVWWLDSYYVQKALNASLLVTVPLAAAALAVALAQALRGADIRAVVAGSVLVCLAGLAVFGTSGTRESTWLEGLPRFAGLEAVDQRYPGSDQTWLGELIVGAVDTAKDLPEFAPVLWEGPGTLANLWTGSLHGTLSSVQQTFYLSLPQPPGGEAAADWAKQALGAYPELRIAFLPPSQESAEFLQLRFGSVDPRRVVVVSD